MSRGVRGVKRPRSTPDTHKGYHYMSLHRTQVTSFLTQREQHLKSIGKDMEYPCRICQWDFYERVVRISELERTRQYIRNNPTK